KMPAEEMVKALPCRPAVKRPRRGDLIDRRQVILAYRECVIIIFMQYLGDGGFIKKHSCIVSRETKRAIIEITHMHRMMIAPGQQRSTGWTANGRRMKIGKTQPVVSQAVQHRCIHQPAK